MAVTVLWQPFLMSMDHYKQILITIEDTGIRDILIALLAEAGYEGFEEQLGALIAFIPRTHFREQTLISLLEPFQLQAVVSDIAPQNWNELWEVSFQPVVIPGYCTVRAAFHPPATETVHEIVITPKMSFGTGHHATTRLMIELMRTVDFSGKNVLDFGTGTGILAILAAKSGAVSVTAVDNDRWSYDNTLENIAANGVVVMVREGSLEVAAGHVYDLILANINRHVLLASMDTMYALTASGGQLLMSGLLTDDRPVVLPAAIAAGWHLQAALTENGWMAFLLKKP